MSHPSRLILRKLYVAVLILGFILCPLMRGRQAVRAENDPQVAFTPHVTPMNFMGTLEAHSISPLETQVPGDVQLHTTPPPDQEPSPKYLIVDGHVFHVGDMFYDAEGLRLSAEHRSAYEKFGYATLMDHPEHRLIWHQDAYNHASFLIIHFEDILYSGENGFLEHFDDLQDGIKHMHGALGAGASGFGAMIAVGATGCVPTVGTTCVIGVVGGFFSLLGGVGGEAWFYFNEVLPAKKAIISTMETIELHR